MADAAPVVAPAFAPGASRARHVAIIMDGNGRWATERGWPRLVGHRRGAERVKQIVRAAPDLGVNWLTLYAFSTENWKRPPMKRIRTPSADMASASRRM